MRHVMRLPISGSIRIRVMLSLAAWSTAWVMGCDGEPAGVPASPGTPVDAAILVPPHGPDAGAGPAVLDPSTWRRTRDGKASDRFLVTRSDDNLSVTGFEATFSFFHGTTSCEFMGRQSGAAPIVGARATVIIDLPPGVGVATTEGPLRKLSMELAFQSASAARGDIAEVRVVSLFCGGLVSIGSHQTNGPWVWLFEQASKNSGETCARASQCLDGICRGGVCS